MILKNSLTCGIQGDSALRGWTAQDLYKEFGNSVDPELSQTDNERKAPDHGTNLWHMLHEYGNYASQLSPYLQNFNRTRFHFIDGQALVKNPDPEFYKIESFLELDHELQFKFNRTKGFPCLDKPIPFCLADSKGRSRGTSKKAQHPEEFAPAETDKIRQFFRREMVQLFRILYPKLKITKFCQDPDTYRFAWLEKVLCPKIQR